MLTETWAEEKGKVHTQYTGIGTVSHLKGHPLLRDCIYQWIAWAASVHLDTMLVPPPPLYEGEEHAPHANKESRLGPFNILSERRRQNVHYKSPRDVHRQYSEHKGRSLGLFREFLGGLLYLRGMWSSTAAHL